jgi:hypothetical protein
MRAVSLIEPLEDRIAPASVTFSANHRTATYKDASGDLVTVTTTQGQLEAGNFLFTDTTATSQLTEFSVQNSSQFNGAAITFSVTPVSGGTDKLNIGFINATNVYLAAVTVPGDLGRIVAGGSTRVGLGTLTVDSLGAQGSSTQGGLSTASTTSAISGSVGTVNIAGNLDGTLGAADFFNHPGTGNIGHLNIGGSLDGNTGTGIGQVNFTGTLGTVVIGGGIEGGGSAFSGTLDGNYGTFSKIGSVIVKGSVPDDPNPNPLGVGTSILGNSGGLSGSILATSVGTVFVAGDVLGGIGGSSGGIQGGNSLGTVTIGGSLIGGNFATGNPGEASGSGNVFAATIGSVTIGKSILGGTGLQSGEIFGTTRINKVTVMGDVHGGTAGQTVNSAAVDGLSGDIRGHAIGTVVVEGSLIGGNGVSGDTNRTGSFGGSIISQTTLGSVYIGKSVVGGSGDNSGSIATNVGNIGSVIVAGAANGVSLAGGAGASSGSIFAGGALTTLMLAQDVAGGSGDTSGSITVGENLGTLALNGGNLTKLEIGGNLKGGTANNTGDIAVFGQLKSGTIKGNVQGSSTSSGSLTDTGYIQVNSLGTLTVGGALISGTASGGGTLDSSGEIRSGTTIGNITVGGLTGNATTPVVISAAGVANLASTATSDIAIGHVTINGNVGYADIAAGYNTDTTGGKLGTGVSADAQIGTVTINGNLTATNIVAGVGPGSSGFGTAGSAALTGAGVTDMPGIISRISSIVVTGMVTSAPSGTYGIAAQQIGSATISGAPLLLTAGASNDTFAAGKEIRLPFLPAPSDLALYEV